MTNYEQHLYNYTELQHKSPNRKLLRNWIRYIQENNVPDGTCYSASVDFMMNDPSVKDKRKSTKRNYNCELNKFNEYIYEQEGWLLPWNNILQTESKKEKIVPPEKPRENKYYTQQHYKTKETTKTIPEDPEYKAFLEKYERLSNHS